MSEQTFKPLNIGRFMFFGGNQKIYGLAIESKVEQGNLRKLAELADNLGIIIRYIQFSMEETFKPTINAIAFLDFSKAKATPKEALEILKNNCDFVENAKIVKPQVNGVIFDDYFFPLIIAEERAVVFRKSVYEALFKGVKEKFGTAGEAMLYYQGFSIGAEIYDYYVKMAKPGDFEELGVVAKAINMTSGWGVIEYVDVNLKKGYAKLRIYKNFECELSSNKKKPQSHFYRGAIAGVFSRVFKKDVNVKEIKCIAMGDPYCEFEIKAK